MNFGAWLGAGVKVFLKSFTLSNLFSYISTLSSGKTRACSDRFNQLNGNVLTYGTHKLTTLITDLQNTCAAYACGSSITAIVSSLVLALLGIILSFAAGDGALIAGTIFGVLGIFILLFSIAVSIGIPFLIAYLLNGYKTKPLGVSTLKVDYFILIVYALYSLWSNILSPVFSSIGDVFTQFGSDFSILALLSTVITLVISLYCGAIILNIIAGALISIEDFVLSIDKSDLMEVNQFNTGTDAWGNGPNLSKDYIEFNKDGNETNWGGQQSQQTNWEVPQTPQNWGNNQPQQTNWENPQVPNDWNNSNQSNDNNNTSW